ncbi:MAG TPA: indole-3-glycerol phosphate synthase TrpC [Blastocatellia bacterium]|nr:indole-3-glycerol phosphate synthase TrpC [Blastocatellia bacterium]
MVVHRTDAEGAQRKTTPPGVLAAGGVLDRIVEAKAIRLAEAKRNVPLEQVIAQCGSHARRSFAESIAKPEYVNIIAEIKHRSPSKGIIRADFNPTGIAESYAEANAAAMSVLAEEDFFGGSLDHLRAIRQRVNTPLLRKDFIFDEYQIYESVAAGADAVLLIVAVLDDELLARLIKLASETGLDALVEVHTADEMKRATIAGAQIIGVNNRDLTTFAVDLKTSFQLAQLAPAKAILVSESGIKTGEDIRNLKSAGFSSFLIGEHFMRAENPGDALGRLIADANES